MVLTKRPSQKTQFLSKLDNLSSIPGTHMTNEKVLCHAHTWPTCLYILTEHLSCRKKDSHHLKGKLFMHPRLMVRNLQSAGLHT